MTILTVFLAGIVFTMLVIPVLQIITDILFGLSDLIKSMILKKSTKYAVEITKMRSELEPSQTQAIGFQIPTDEEEYFDEDYDDKLDNKTHRKVGF